VHLVEADKIDPAAAQPAYDVIQKAWPDLEKPVGLKAIQPRWTHVVNGQNRAHPANERTQQVMGGAEIKRLETTAENRFPEGIQCGIPLLCPAR
jgi:hypothetical protein